MCSLFGVLETTCANRTSSEQRVVRKKSIHERQKETRVTLSKEISTGGGEWGRDKPVDATLETFFQMPVILLQNVAMFLAFASKQVSMKWVASCW